MTRVWVVAFTFKPKKQAEEASGCLQVTAETEEEAVAKVRVHEHVPPHTKFQVVSARPLWGRP
ncbi:MAG: hypothetical protein ACREVM_04890 [Burkholderiales bacterium]